MLNADVVGRDKQIERWNGELAFRAVVEATADKAGLEFMRHLVKNLAESLGVAYAFVAEFAGAEDRVKTIAFWSRDDWAPNVEFPLSGTPCQRVVAGELCLYRDEVQTLFPLDTDLVTLGVRSYLGVPLRGANGQTLGHLAALDTEPMDEDPRGLTIFQVFANRARVEMERLHAEAVLQRAFSDLEVRLESTAQDLAVTRQSLDLAYGELRALLEINQSSTRHLHRTDLFTELARSVKPLLPCERFGIEVPTGPESLRVHVLALDQPARGPMIEEFPSAGTACRWAQEQRHWYVANSREELRERFPMTHVVMERESMESLYALPLLRETKSFGALFFMSTRRDAYRDVPQALIERVGSAVAVAVDNCFAYEELQQLRDQLAAENVYLKEEIQHDHNFREIVGRSPALAKVLSLVENVAPTPSTVLILGETGTGKELIARAIHDRSPRRDRPLVKVNCSAISAGLVESELFGHERGAFTGAVRAHTGRFEIANGGTIFLDEVGELPLDTQVKLLRVLQEREIEPVGGTRSKKVDVRVIAATNRDLEAEVAAGRFRADLFFRLNVFPIVTPPLRERSGDIELLVSYFVDRFARELGKRIDGVSRATLDRLLAYHWPGNVRELSNLIERGVVLANGPFLELGADLPAPAGARALPVPPAAIAASTLPSNGARRLAEVERQHLLDTLAAVNWTIEGERGAAAQLGLRPSTLRSRMKKLGVRRPEP
ncbi:MAG TPA: sigma 54-interacting transcriptional regulator [Candidatus Dormibacteraeota bacterium]|nr:sigma 54-interacting transcriptional regulator [Candidatus Dormibacteraeota bacterium]